jgi:plastocyanin
VRKSMFSGIAAGFILIIATACGSSAASQAPAASVASSAGGGGAITCSAGVAAGQPVSIKSFAFNPGTIAVSAGSTVTWTNSDATEHTVTFDSGPDCGKVPTSGTASASFSTAGTFAYHCTIHPSMKGTVTVS